VLLAITPPIQIGDQARDAVGLEAMVREREAEVGLAYPRGAIDDG